MNFLKPVGSIRSESIEVGHIVLHKDHMWRVVQNISVLSGRLLILAHHTWSDPIERYDYVEKRRDVSMQCFVECD